jgi:hypothetical protein
VAKVQVKKSPVKKTVLKAVPTEPEIPILMRPSVAKPKKKRKPISDLEVLFHVNAASAVLMAFINAFNGGIVVVTMLAMTMAFVTEIFVMAVRDYSGAHEELAKYKAILKSKIEKIKKKKNVA